MNIIFMHKLRYLIHTQNLQSVAALFLLALLPRALSFFLFLPLSLAASFSSGI